MTDFEKIIYTKNDFMNNVVIPSDAIPRTNKDWFIETIDLVNAYWMRYKDKKSTGVREYALKICNLYMDEKEAELRSGTNF